MDKSTQNLTAAALFILGIYTLIIGGIVSVPYHTHIVVSSFWIEFALIVTMLFRLKQSPMAVLPAAFAVLCIIVPSAPVALSASTGLIRHLVH